MFALQEAGREEPVRPSRRASARPAGGRFRRMERPATHGTTCGRSSPGIQAGPPGPGRSVWELRLVNAPGTRVDSRGRSGDSRADLSLLAAAARKRGAGTVIHPANAPPAGVTAFRKKRETRAGESTRGDRGHETPGPGAAAQPQRAVTAQDIQYLVREATGRSQGACLTPGCGAT